MTLVQTEPKSIKIGTTDIKRVTIRPGGVEKQIRPAIDYLCFTAEQANSTVTLNKTGSPTAVTLETSTDGSTWSTYTFGNTITLSNIGDKVYWRNTSTTTTGFSTSTSIYYAFTLGGSLSASGDVTSLINKNCTDTLTGAYCFCKLFYNTTPLLLPPSLPATTLTNYCYRAMFTGCTNMVGIPELPATTLTNYCYYQMFYNCSKLKLSSTQTGSYTQEYRIPTTGTGTTASNWNYRMFTSTGGTFAGEPTIDTTYYVHTDNTIVG